MRGVHPRNLAGSRAEFGGAARLFFTKTVLALAFAFALLSSFAVAVPAFAQEDTSSGDPDVSGPSSGDIPALQDIPEEQQPEECEGTSGAQGGSAECRAALEELAAEQPSGDEGGGSDDSGGGSGGGGSGGGDSGGGSDDSGGGSGGEGEVGASNCTPASETFLGEMALAQTDQTRGWASEICQPDNYSLMYVEPRSAGGMASDSIQNALPFLEGNENYGMGEYLSFYVINTLASVVMTVYAWGMLFVISLINFSTNFNLAGIIGDESLETIMGGLTNRFFNVWLPVVYALALGYGAWISIARDKVAEGFGMLLKTAIIGAFSVWLLSNPVAFVNGYNDVSNSITNVAYTFAYDGQSADPQTFQSNANVASAQSEEGAPVQEQEEGSSEPALQGFSNEIWQSYVFTPWAKVQLGTVAQGNASNVVELSGGDRREELESIADESDEGYDAVHVSGAISHFLGAVAVALLGVFFGMLALAMSLLLMVIQAAVLILLITAPIWLLFAVYPGSNIPTRMGLYFLGLNLEVFAYKLLLSLYVIIVGTVVSSASLGLAALICLILSLVAFRFKKDLIRLLTPNGITNKLSSAANRAGAQPAGAATGGSSAYGGSEAPAARPSMVTRMGGSKAASAPGTASATAAGMKGAAGAGAGMAAGAAASPVTKPAKAVGKGVKGGASTLRKGSKGVRMAQTGEGKGLGRNAELLSRSEGKTGKAAFLGSKVKSARDAKKAAGAAAGAGTGRGGASMADRVNSIPASARRSPDNAALMGTTKDTADGRKLLPLSEYARKGAGSRGSTSGPAKGTLNERMNGIAASRKRKPGAAGELSRSSDTANGGKYIPLSKFAKSTPDTNRSTPATGAAAGAAGAAAGSGLRGARDRARDRVGGAANAAGVGQTGYADRPGRGEEPGIVGRSRNRMAAAKHLKDYQKRAMREAILRDGVAGGAKAASGGPQAAVAGATKGAATGAAKGTGAALGEYKNNFGDMAKGRDVSPEGKAKRAAQQGLQNSPQASAAAEQAGAGLSPSAQAERRRESGAYSGAQLKDDSRSQIMGKLTGRDGANVSPDDPARESVRDTLERAEAGDSQAMAQMNGADPQGDIDRREALALLGTEEPGDGPDGTGGGGASGIGAGAAGAAGSAAGAGAGAAGDATGAAKAAQDAQNGAAAGAAGMAAGAAGGAAAGAAASRGGASGSSADSGYAPDVAETGGQVERGIHRDSENFGAAAVDSGSGEGDSTAEDAGVDGAASGVGDSGGEPDTGGVAGAGGPGEDSGPAPEDAMMGIAGVPGGGSGDDSVDEESGAIAEAPDGPDSFGVDAGSVPAGAAYEPSSGAIVGDGNPEGAFMAAAPAGFVAREGSEGEGRWEPLPATSEGFAGPDGGGAWMDAHGYSPEGDGFLDSATAESWKAEDAELSSMQAAHNARSADLFSSYQSGDPGYDDKLGAWQAEGDALAAREEEVALGRRQQRLDSWDGSSVESMEAPAAAAAGGGSAGGGGPPEEPPDDSFSGGGFDGDPPDDGGGSDRPGGGSGGEPGNGGADSGTAGGAFEDRVAGAQSGESPPSASFETASSDFSEDSGGSSGFGAFAAGAASGAVAGGIAGAAAGGLFGGGKDSDNEESPSDLDRMDDFAAGGSNGGPDSGPGEDSGGISDADKLDNLGGGDASPASTASGDDSGGDDLGGDNLGGDDLAGFDSEARIDEVSRRGAPYAGGASGGGDDLADLDRAASGGEERPGGDFHRHNSHNLGDEFERTVDPGQYGEGGYEYDRKREIAEEMHERRTEDLEDTMESGFESEHQNRERFLKDAREDGQDVSDIERGWLNEARSRRRKLDS